MRSPGEAFEHLDGGREAGSEDVRRKVGILRQNLIGSARGEENDLFEGIHSGGRDGRRGGKRRLRCRGGGVLVKTH